MLKILDSRRKIFFGLDFFVKYHTNLDGLLNAKANLIEEQ